MKYLPALTALATLVAFALLPHTLPIAASLLFGACLISIFAADYARTIQPLEARATLVTLPRPARRAAAFGLAA